MFPALVSLFLLDWKIVYLQAGPASPPKGAPPDKTGVHVEDDERQWWNETGGKRFIKLHLYEEGQWMETQELIALLEEGMEFIDMTEAQGFVYHHENLSYPIPKKLRFKPLVHALLQKINVGNMEAFVKSFTEDFSTRFYWTEEAYKSTQWLKQQLEAVSKVRKGRINVTIWEKKDFWKMRSVFARIEGMNETVKDQIIIMGAHVDSVNSTCFFKPSIPCAEMRAPGAVDNAAGASVLLETFRILVSAGFIPKRSIEFHFYSAEEVGSRGSISVSLDYRKRNLKVVGFLNMDTVAYAPGKEFEKIGVQSRDTDEKLTEFITLVAKNYANVPIINKNFCPKCYSDYASWTEVDYPSADVHQIKDFPLMHTWNDTINYVNFPYVAEFVKICVGYVVEYGEPMKIAVDAFVSPDVPK